MKKIFLLLAFTIFTLNTWSQAIVSDSTTMGQGYANEVFYSMENGTVSTNPTSNWHLAFRSGMVSDGIFINSTASVRGFLTKKDTSGWSTLDTSDATTEVFNTDTSWEVGAFNRTFDSPFCSWGVYDNITHKVTGDSLLLVKVGNNNWFKVWPVYKDYGTWKIRVASATIDTTFIFTNAEIRNSTFGYINLNTMTFLLREPVDSTWDIKFTRYAAFQPQQMFYYPVTGVLNNRMVRSSKATGVEKETYSNYMAHPFVTNISVIGADWKSFDNNTFQWKIADSTVYFVRARDGDIWRMWFTGFGGTGNGKSYFNKQKLFTVGLGERNKEVAKLALYPNPATDKVTLVIDHNNLNEVSITLTDLSGRKVWQETRQINNGMDNLTLDLAGVQTGIYLVSMESNNYKAVSRVVINK